jgi:hypothetical protein
MMIKGTTIAIVFVVGLLAWFFWRLVQVAQLRSPLDYIVPKSGLGTNGTTWFAEVWSNGFDASAGLDALLAQIASAFGHDPETGGYGPTYDPEDARADTLAPEWVQEYIQ